MGEIVKADPGFYHLEAVHDREDGWSILYKRPIIAWRLKTNVDGDVDAEPICTHCNLAYDDRVALLCPDGRVIDCTGSDLDSVDSWFEVLDFERRAELALKAEKVA
jgi:hypothetical protein